MRACSLALLLALSKSSALVVTASLHHMHAPKSAHRAAASPAMAQPAVIASGKAAVVGMVSYVAASRTAQAVLVAGALVITSELSKRAKLIETSETCMMGDESACKEYDQRVDATAGWKLRKALNKLSLTNTLQARLDGAPPSGFSWGKTF